MLIWTPDGSSNLFILSVKVVETLSKIIKRLWVLLSNCSRDFLLTWTLLKIVTISLRVGKGIGPLTLAFSPLAKATIFLAASSTK